MSDWRQIDAETERLKAESEERKTIVGSICGAAFFIVAVLRVSACVMANDAGVTEVRRLEALAKVCPCDAGAR